MSALFGHARHHWLWDFKAARLELERSGFREIRRAQYGDSSEASFADVEEEARWANCLGIKSVGNKPPANARTSCRSAPVPLPAMTC